MSAPVRIIVETKDTKVIGFMADAGAKSYMDLEVASNAGIDPTMAMMSVCAMALEVAPEVAKLMLAEILVELAKAAGGRLLAKLSLEAGSGPKLVSDVVRISADEGDHFGSEATITIRPDEIDLVVSGSFYESHPDKSLETANDDMAQVVTELRTHMVANRSFRTRLIVNNDPRDWLEWGPGARTAKCPICQTPKAAISVTNGDAKRVSCSGCGVFQISGTALTILDNHRALIAGDVLKQIQDTARRLSAGKRIVRSGDLPAF